MQYTWCRPQAIEVGLSAPTLYGRLTRRGNVIFDGGPHERTEETEFLTGTGRDWPPWRRLRGEPERHGESSHRVRLRHRPGIRRGPPERGQTRTWIAITRPRSWAQGHHLVW
jgi:hypothetical protein